MRNADIILVGKLEEKSPFRRHRHRWKNNIRMNLSETGWKCVDWIHMPQNRNQWQALVNMVTNLGVP
jgi:hypothetical protein